jgi:hypothetical protein
MPASAARSAVPFADAVSAAVGVSMMIFPAVFVPGEMIKSAVEIPTDTKSSMLQMTEDQKPVANLVLFIDPPYKKDNCSS